MKPQSSEIVAPKSLASFNRNTNDIIYKYHRSILGKGEGQCVSHRWLSASKSIQSSAEDVDFSLARHLLMWKH
jgi:hypothetical protein